MGPVDKPTNRWPATMLLLLLTASLAQAGPVIRSRRMIREIYVENSAAAPTAPDSASSDVPSGNGGSNATAASDMCLYDGSYIERSAIACEKKHGCRAIQKTGECCPDYQCECQRDGKTYANGEKVFDPNTPCRACYCQGGEITCSEVSCYKRNDCDPKYIPGRCCPEYDNCPPLENFKITDTNTKDATGGERNDEETNEVKGNYAAEVEDLAGLQKHQTTTATTTTTTAASVSSGPAISNDNPLGIKIKEITKPEEIRLTDNRPSAEEQQQQQQQQQLAAANREASGEHSSSQSEELVNLEHLDVHVPDDDGENGTKIVRHTPDGDGMHSEANVSESSASEESVVKISASAENRLESAESSTVGTVSSTLSESEEWMDIKEFADSSTWSPSSGSSSGTTQAPSAAPSTSGPHEEDVVSESNMKPSKQDNALPAVVQIGDKLVIVDHNQPKPITVIQVEEVEGLQRGEDDTVYDQEMYTERSLSPAAESGRESSKKLKLSHSTEQEQETLSTQADSSGAYETVYHAGSTEQGGGSSEEFYETVFYTEGPESALTSQERNETQDRLQTREPVSVSKEDFLHMGASQEPAKLQQDEEHTTAGASTSVTSAEEGSTTLSDLSISLSSEASGDEMIYDTHYYTEEPPGSASDEHGPTLGTGSAESSTAGYVPRHPVPVADELVPPHATYIEDNEKEFIDPGFQPIPEDFSLPQLDHPAMEMELDHHPKSGPVKQEKILADVLMELKRNSTTTTDHPNTASSTESSTTEGFQEAASNSPSWLKEEPRPQLRSPGEPLLVPEWERANGTQGSSNSSSEEQLEASGSGASSGDFQMLKMGSEEYVDAGEGSGQQPVGSTPTSQPSKAIENRSEEEEDDETSGKGELEGSAEASTSTKPLLDIDSPANVTADEQSDSVKHNPKNDVESLKYDEDENNATAEEAIPKKVQQLEPAGERDGTPTLTGV